MHNEELIVDASSGQVGRIGTKPLPLNPVTGSSDYIFKCKKQTLMIDFFSYQMSFINISSWLMYVSNEFFFLKKFVMF